MFCATFIYFGLGFLDQGTFDVRSPYELVIF